MSILTQYIGPEGAAFQRVRLAFESVGFEPPRPDTNADGAYVSNIVRQYESSLTPRQVAAIVRHGLDMDRAGLKATQGVYSVRDLESLYGDDDGDR